MGLKRVEHQMIYLLSRGKCLRRNPTSSNPQNRPSLASAVRDRSSLTRIKLAPSYGYQPLATLDHDSINDQPTESSLSPSVFEDGLDAWRDNCGELVPAELGLSEALCCDLARWNADYEMFFNETDPTAPRCTAEHEACHAEEGYNLALRLQEERPDLEVYVNESAELVRIIDLKSRPHKVDSSE